MEMSGQEAPVSQLLTVLLDTPKRSAASCWVYPLDFRSDAKNSPMSVFAMEVLLCVFRYNFTISGSKIQRGNGAICSRIPGISPETGEAGNGGHLFRAPRI